MFYRSDIRPSPEGSAFLPARSGAADAVSLPAGKDGIRALLLGDVRRAIVRAHDRVTEPGRGQRITTRPRYTRRELLSRSDELGDAEEVRAQLRRAAQALGWYERERDTDLKQVLVVLKEILESSYASNLGRDLARSLEADVTSWAIEAYYSRERRPHPVQ